MLPAAAVVIAPDAGIVRQVSGKEGLHCLISTAGNTAVQPDPRRGQRLLRASANTAADQRVGAQGIQNAGQRAMAAAAGIHNP